MILATLADLQRASPPAWISRRPGTRRLLAEKRRFRRRALHDCCGARTIAASSTAPSLSCERSLWASRFNDLDEKQAPYAPIRWINQWDNLDGSIERGYGGRSIFWENGHVRKDLSRVAEYGRLLASLGINGCSINNVNADPRLLTPAFMPQIARIAAALRPWGVQVAISVDFGSPQTIGGLETFDPLDRRVAAWWEARTSEMYARCSRPGRLRVEGRFRGPRRPLDIRPYARRCRQRGGPRVKAARRAALLPRLRLRPPRGLAQSEERPRARRLRQFPPAGWPVRRQCDRPDQERSHRFSGPRAGLSAVRRARKNQPGHRTPDHAGIHGAGPRPGFPRSHVEGDARFRNGRARQGARLGPDFPRPTGGFVGVANVGLDDNWLGNHLSQANYTASDAWRGIRI